MNKHDKQFIVSIFFIAAMEILVSARVRADVVANVTPSTWDLYYGSTKSKSGLPTQAACAEAARLLGLARNYQCRTRTAVTISIVATPPITATLNWTAPKYNTDGSALTNLAAYRIYYGTSADALTQRIDVTDVKLVSYVVPNLTKGQWYFEMTAINSDGIESAHTGFVTVVL